MIDGMKRCNVLPQSKGSVATREIFGKERAGACGQSRRGGSSKFVANITRLQGGCIARLFRPLKTIENLAFINVERRSGALCLNTFSRTILEETCKILTRSANKARIDCAHSTGTVRIVDEPDRAEVLPTKL